MLNSREAFMAFTFNHEANKKELQHAEAIATGGSGIQTAKNQHLVEGCAIKANVSPICLSTQTLLIMATWRSSHA
jgi:hypothetical protein